MNINFICGCAGSGKTTLICQQIKDKLSNSANKNKHDVICICISETHSSKQNLKNKFVSMFPDFVINLDKIFKTIFSYFRIDYKTDNMLGPLATETSATMSEFNLFVDEFSLISPNMFRQCLRYLNNYKIANILIFGDPLQLSSIESKRVSLETSELLRYSALIDKLLAVPAPVPVPLSLETLNKIIIHFKKSLMFNIKSESLIWLDENKRSSSENLSKINSVLDGDEELIKSLCITRSNVISLMKEKNYVYISSIYEELTEINKLINSSPTKMTFKHDKLGEIYLEPNSKVYFTESTPDFLNGEHGTIISIAKDFIEILNIEQNKPIKKLLNIVKDETTTSTNPINIINCIMPNNLITFHKSQGLAFDGAIISSSKLFDIPMIYTGITRTVNNFYFYGNPKELLKNITDFKLLKTLIIGYIKSGDGNGNGSNI
jgi:hypothetical protein